MQGGSTASSSGKAMAFSDTAPSWDVLTEMVRWVSLPPTLYVIKKQL
jgi:hypothetical protein